MSALSDVLKIHVQRGRVRSFTCAPYMASRWTGVNPGQACSVFGCPCNSTTVLNSLEPERLLEYKYNDLSHLGICTPSSHRLTDMAMNFAPYQSSPPESTRALSPPLRSPAASPTLKIHAPQPQRNISSIANREDPWAAARNQRLPSPSQYADEEYTDLESGSHGPRQNDYLDNRGDRAGGYTYAGGSTSPFETSLGFSLQLEACLAYLLLPPAGGVALLIFERKSDYVRYHAWQSALVFSALFMVHVIFSWTAIISWILFAFDLVLIAYLAYGAWRNAETLDRVEVPFFGRLASSFVDDE